MISEQAGEGYSLTLSIDKLPDDYPDSQAQRWVFKIKDFEFDGNEGKFTAIPVALSLQQLGIMDSGVEGEQGVMMEF